MINFAIQVYPANFLQHVFVWSLRAESVKHLVKYFVAAAVALLANGSFADEILTPFKLKLVCDLSDKTTLIGPKGVSEGTELISAEVVDITVSYLSSSPESRFLNLKAMNSPYIQFYNIPLFESKAEKCSIDFHICRATVADDEIYSGKEYVGANERRHRRVKIDRTTGRLDAYDTLTDRGMTLIHQISGFCRKASTSRAF